jgi:5'-methylthioadenosine phosphorylase
MIAIFGGTAAYHLNLSDFAQVLGPAVTRTPFGDVTFTRLRTEGGTECLFLSRHGAGRLARSARFVNHRAHIAGAADLNVTGILSWNGVGAINPALAVGDLVVPDDLLDQTRSRVAVMGWGPEISSSIASPPFAPPLRAALVSAAQTRQLPTTARATYVCTEGPRLETPAEIAAFGRLGADVVGMTLCPEVWLADEIGLHYASLCAVTNMAAGLAHLNPARNFGPEVGAKCLRVCLAAVENLGGW